MAIDEHYNNTINYIGRQINKKYVNNFKQLGNNPSNLTKFIYISEVLNDINNYMITDKADGLRTFLLISSDRDSNYINGNEQSYISNELLGITPTNKYILDCEYVTNNNGEKIFYVFDIIIFNGENISNKPFTQRYEYLQKLEQNLNIKKNSVVKIKKFYKLNVKDYQKNIMLLWNDIKNKKYNTDGIIFTNITNNYNNTVNLKWKPIEHLTIDFFCIKSKKSNEYVLLNGISNKVFKRIGLTFDEEYLDLLKSVQNIIDIDLQFDSIKIDYFPVIFKPSFSPIPFIHLFKSEIDIHGKIVELSYYTEKNIWKFNRIRNDREKELRSGKYYGNNFNIAELTFQSILNPLTLKELVKPFNQLTDSFYFEKQDNTYLYVRKANSFVKRNLINRYNNSTYLIDMASGKGQDLLNYYNNKINNLLFLENDINAIDEVIKRKYEFVKKIELYNENAPIRINGYKSEGTHLDILNMDLNNDYKKNIKNINTMTNFEKHNIPIIFCNLAFHYLISNINDAKNAINFIDFYLSKNGEFVFTALDGRKVFNLLKENKGKWEHKENGKTKYMISLVNQADIKLTNLKPFNVKIRVLLPCSNTPYEETLVDLFALDKLFKSSNIQRIEEKNHDQLLNNFKEYKPEFYNKLSLDDKKFIGLYKYAVYKRI
jgi:hypothetical protein